MIATTISQSNKLIAIGIDPSTADMYYPNRIGMDNYTLSIEWKNGNTLLSQEIPAWSLGALLQYLREVDFFPYIEVDETAVKMTVFYYDDEEGKVLSPVHTIEAKGESFIDAALELIVKLKENKCI